GKISDVEIDSAVVIVISDRQTHARLFSAVFIQRNSRGITHFLKSSIAFVDIELFGSGIVNNDEIKKLVVVGMNKGRTKTVVFLRIAYVSLHTHIFETAVGLLMVEGISFSLKTSRAAHNRD